MTAAVAFMSAVPRMVMHRDWYIYPAWAHPQVRYWAPTWMQIRDCMLGDQEIKFKGEVYLPRLSDMDNKEYERYLDMAVFFNMTARTINALTGTVFQREPKVKGLPPKLDNLLNSAAYNGISFTSFTTAVVEGVCAMGRYGVLVDMAADGKGTPFLRGYDTENIVDWQMDWVDGRFQPVQIVLREFVELVDRKVGSYRKYKIVWRALCLDIEPDGPVYRQYVYETFSMAFPVDQAPSTIHTPTYRGKPFNTIPFWPIGAKDNTFEVDRPPAADIASLNLAHYKSYAHLEHGRYYCAMPIYYVQTMPNSEKAEYTLGPSRVWEVAAGEKPGILEFNGQGLKTLENSLAQKEEQISMIGGRLVGGLARSVSESDNQAKIKETNERALLLKVVQNVEDGLELALKFWGAWQDETNFEPDVDLNTAFIFDNLGARELRAAHQMYAAGVIPVTALHNYLLKAELIPEWMDVEEFKRLLNQADEFPNQPDVWAKMQGYSDAKDRHDVLLERRTLRDQEDQTEINMHLAETQRIEIEGTLDVQQQQVDVQQQLADQAAAQHAKDMVMKQKQIDAQQKTAKALAKQAGRPVVNPQNPNSKPLPPQVSAARNAAANDPGNPANIKGGN